MKDTGTLRSAATLLDQGSAKGRLLLSRGQNAAEVADWLRSEADSALGPDPHAVELARLLLAAEAKP